MTHAYLRAGQHQEGVFETRGMIAIYRQMRRHQPMRADIDLRKVLHIRCRVAGKTRSHEQRHLISPGHERTFEQAAACRAAAIHEAGERFGLAAFEADPALHVHATEQKGGIDAVVNVAGVNVRVTLRARAVENVAIPRAIDRHRCPDRLASGFALKDHPRDRTVAHQRHRAPGVENQVDLVFQHQFLGHQLKMLRVHGWRPGDDTVVGRGALLPVSGGGFIRRAP